MRFFFFGSFRREKTQKKESREEAKRVGPFGNLRERRRVVRLQDKRERKENEKERREEGMVY